MKTWRVFDVQLLERIRYLLEVARPPAAIAPLLAILTRHVTLICKRNPLL